MDELEAERMVAAYVDEGLSLSEIGTRHGCSSERVRKMIEHMGVARRSAAEGSRLAGIARRTPLLPQVIDEDTAWLAGAVAGDGWLTNDGVHLAAGLDESFARIFLEVGERKLGISGSVKQNNRGYWEAHLWSMEAANAFYDLGKRHSWDWFIPKSILSASDDILASFLRGLFDADGGVILRSRTVCLTTVSKVATKQLVSTFARLGLEFGPPRVYVPSEPKHRTKYMFRLVHVQRLEVFEQKVGFRVPRKAEELREAIGSVSVRRLPKCEVDALEDEMFQLASEGESVKAIARKLGLSRQSVLDCLRHDATLPFGEALRKARELRGWTQTALAKLMGLSASARVSVWEGGAGQLPRPATMETLVRLMPELLRVAQVPNWRKYEVDELEPEILRLAAKGLSPTAIAARLGLAQTAVIRRLRGHENRLRFGTPVRVARERAGLTREALATRIGMSRDATANWETGAGKPGPGAIRALASALPKLGPILARGNQAE